MKKVISLLIVFSIIVTLVATVGITSVSAATTNLYDWDYYNKEDGKLYSSLSEDGKYGGKEFHVNADYVEKSTVTYYDKLENVSDDPFLNIISENFLCNFNTAVDMTKPVINFSFKMYIPTADLKNVRQVNLSLAKRDADGNYTNNTYGTVYLTMTSSSGNAYGGASGNATNIYRKSTAVTGDKWHQMNIRVYTHEEGKITFAMYMDGMLFIVCESAASDIRFDDIGVRQLFIKTTANTYIKDMSLATEYYDTTLVPDADVLHYSNVDFNTPHTILSTNGFQSTDNGTAKVFYQTSSQTTKPHYYTGSVYQNMAYENEDGAMKITLTPSDTVNATHATIQNFQKNLTTYFPADTTKYMQMSYDVKVASGSESATRSQIWRLGNNTAANSSVYAIGSKMVDNKICFYQEGTYLGTDTRKSITLDVESDKWYRIIKLLKITNSGTNYLITTEGFVIDLETDISYKIYESYTEVPKATVVEEAITDGIKLTQARTDITTLADTEKKSVVTYYDNIVSRIWDTDFSTYYSNMNDLIDPITLTVNNKAVTAKGLVLNGNGTQKVVIAGYNANGKLVKMAISDDSATIDATKGTVEFTYDFADYTDVKTVKAFMFDSISTAKPLGYHAVTELK
ncbi:MAG: hypothetical protein IKV86_00970 [Clostridia bacterium]|nr:hypothetical protein [Clostridia bacterium]